MQIVLASGSPRRRELLTTAQLEFSVLQVDIDETLYENESPKDYIQRMVATKTTAAITKLNLEYKNKPSKTSFLLPNESFIILTSDTIGVLPDGKTVLVKPIDRHHAYDMWQKMSDNTHQVWTAVQATQVTVNSPESLNDGNKQLSRDTYSIKAVQQQHIIECTEVTFVPLTVDMMVGYWNSGEPADKAGGYGIQGLAAAWVSRINGSYTNVVGLPLAQTLALIEAVSRCASPNKNTEW